MRSLRILPVLLLGLMAVSCGGKKVNYDASGVFEATEVLVSAQVAGPIIALDAPEGASVESGVSIGLIDTTQLFLKKKQLLASNKALMARSRDIPRQLSALRQQIATAKNEQQRFKALVASDAATQKQLDDINAQVAYLESQLAAQTELLTSSNRGVTDEVLAMAVQVEQIDDMIKRSVISSPIRGVILARYAEAGELAAQGRPLFKVGDIDRMFLKAYITSSQINSLKIGQSVTVFADEGDSGRRQYEGTVSWISDKAEFTPKTIQTRDERANLVYAVKIAVKNDGFIKRGMYGDVKF